MKKIVVGVLLTMIVLLSACGGSGGNSSKNNSDPKSTDNSQTASGGEAIFQQSTCTSCHGTDLTGGVGPDLTAVGSKYSQEEILSIIEKGKGGMPGGVIKGDDAKQVAEWLSTKK